MTTQNTPQAQNFTFPAGTGVIRWKIAKDLTSMYFGRIALPEHGQCYVDGTSPKGAVKAKLTVRRASDRKVIASLTFPRGFGEEFQGEVKTRGKTWRLVATVRRNESDEPRLALRLPEVKIAGAYV